MIKKIEFNYTTFLLPLLGILSAFGPFVTDMYLPALPQLQGYFSTDEPMVQMSISAGLMGLAVGQLCIGPMSDKYGRKPLLIIALWMFILSTVACIYAPTIEVFLVMRLLQGVGGSGGIVLARSIATDRYWGEKLSKIMPVVGAIYTVAAVLIPVVGGAMTDSIGWRGIFWLLAFVGVVLLISTHFIHESLAHDKRSGKGIMHTFASFGKIFHNPRFMYIWLQYGFCGGAFFAYLASSPFIIQEHYGFSPVMYSIIFGFNALMVGVGCAAAINFRTPMRCTHVASITLMVSAIVECTVLWMDGSFWIYEVLAVIMRLCIGLCFTSSTVLALNEEHEHAGAASALVGAILFVVGSVVSPFIGFGDLMHTTGTAMVVCAAFALLFSFLSKKVLGDKVIESRE